MIDKQEIYHAISKYESSVETYANRVSTLTVSAEDFYNLKERKLERLWEIIGELESQAMELGFPKDNLLEIEVIKMIAWFYENSVEISKTKGGKVHESQIEHQKKYWLDGIRDYAVMLYDFIAVRTYDKDTTRASGLKHGVWINPKEFPIGMWNRDITRLVIAFRNDDEYQTIPDIVSGFYHYYADRFYSDRGDISIGFHDGLARYTERTDDTYTIEVVGYMLLPTFEGFMM